MVYLHGKCACVTLLLPALILSHTSVFEDCCAEARGVNTENT